MQALISSRVVVFLTNKTLAYYFRFLGFFNFDFGALQRRQFEDIVLYFGRFQFNKE